MTETRASEREERWTLVKPCHPDDLSVRCFWRDFRNGLVVVARQLKGLFGTEDAR